MPTRRPRDKLAAELTDNCLQPGATKDDLLFTSISTGWLVDLALPVPPVTTVRLGTRFGVGGKQGAGLHWYRLALDNRLLRTIESLLKPIGVSGGLGSNPDCPLYGP